MDQLENRLVDVLDRVADQAEPAVARLRNPAAGQAPAGRPTGLSRLPRTYPRTFTVLAAAASAVVVAGVAVGVGLAVDRADRTPSPAHPVIGTSDGVRPLWELEQLPDSSHSFFELRAGQVDAPLPRLVNTTPSGSSKYSGKLVTATGTYSMPGQDVQSMDLLAHRGVGDFLEVNHGRDGVDETRNPEVFLVTPQLERRDVFTLPTWDNVSVSPDGRTLAVATNGELDLVDVASGDVVHRLPVSSRVGTAWASDGTLVVLGTRTAAVWSEPWTGPAEPTGVRYSNARSVQGGVVLLDDSTGCLTWIDSAGAATRANCAGWTDVSVAPEGRYLSVTWTDDGSTRLGVLDLKSGSVRPWPVRKSVEGGWVSPTEFLADEDLEDMGMARSALCDAVTFRCVNVTDQLRADPEPWGQWQTR